MNNPIASYLASAIAPTSLAVEVLNGQATQAPAVQAAPMQALQPSPVAQYLAQATVEPAQQPERQALKLSVESRPARAAKYIGAIAEDASPKLYDFISSVEQRLGLPQGILVALKDRGEKSGSNATSPVGAMGIFQFMPSTWKAYGGDASPRDPYASTEAAGKFVKDLLRQYGGNAAAAIAHYNGGTKQGKLVAEGKDPTFAETRAYVRRVLS